MKKTLEKGYVKRIHVNQHNIRANQKDGGNRLAITVKTARHNYKANTVEIHGPSRVMYRPDKPMNCGARVWIYTIAELSLEGGDDV